VSISDELKERNILNLILVMRFACATLDVGHSIILRQLRISFTSTRVCFGKVQGSLHFGRAITLLRSYRTEDEISHSDGSIG
jgi:hypothetical protein